MAGHLYEDGKHIGHIENGFAFDRHGEKRFQVDHPKLRDIKTGEVVGYLNAVGLPGTVTKKACSIESKSPLSASSPSPHLPNH